MYSILFLLFIIILLSRLFKRRSLRAFQLRYRRKASKHGKLLVLTIIRRRVLVFKRRPVLAFNFFLRPILPQILSSVVILFVTFSGYRFAFHGDIDHNVSKAVPGPVDNLDHLNSSSIFRFDRRVLAHLPRILIRNSHSLDPLRLIPNTLSNNPRHESVIDGSILTRSINREVWNTVNAIVVERELLLFDCYLSLVHLSFHRSNVVDQTSHHIHMYIIFGLGLSALLITLNCSAKRWSAFERLRINLLSLLVDLTLEINPAKGALRLALQPLHRTRLVEDVLRVAG